MSYPQRAAALITALAPNADPTVVGPAIIDDLFPGELDPVLAAMIEEGTLAPDVDLETLTQAQLAEWFVRSMRRVVVAKVKQARRHKLEAQAREQAAGEEVLPD